MTGRLLGKEHSFDAVGCLQPWRFPSGAKGGTQSEQSERARERARAHTHTHSRTPLHRASGSLAVQAANVGHALDEVSPAQAHACTARHTCACVRAHAPTHTHAHTHIHIHTHARTKPSHARAPHTRLHTTRSLRLRRSCRASRYCCAYAHAETHPKRTHARRTHARRHPHAHVDTHTRAHTHMHAWTDGHARTTAQARVRAAAATVCSGMLQAVLPADGPRGRPSRFPRCTRRGPLTRGDSVVLRVGSNLTEKETAELPPTSTRSSVALQCACVRACVRDCVRSACVRSAPSRRVPVCRRT